MPRLKRTLPAYRLHKPSGQAVVTLSSTFAVFFGYAAGASP